MWKIFGIAETQMPGVQSPVHSLVHSDRYSAARDWLRWPGAGAGEQITVSQLSPSENEASDLWAIERDEPRALPNAPLPDPVLHFLVHGMPRLLQRQNYLTSMMRLM